MRNERTDSFKSDYNKLTPIERELFRSAVKDFNAACDQFLVRREWSVFPNGLRVKRVSGTKGIFEMTWSFSGPDGRATWEWTSVTDSDGKERPAVRWRRVGNHDILREP